MTQTVHTMDGTMLSRYAAVMVPLDLGTGAPDRVRVAGSIAGRFSARLIGIAAQQIVLPLYSEGALGVTAELVAIEQDHVAAELAQAEEIFRAAAEGQPDTEWRSAVWGPHPYICQQARVADLVVISNDVNPSRNGMAVNAGDLLMALGLPVLVVPPSITDIAARQIVIAWKNTREARRAVWDSLPLLKRAHEVLVVAIGPDAKQEGADDVSTNLRRHGVNSRAVVRAEPNGSVTGELLAIAAREGADLIVSGAYGHSRAREWVFGGVTHDLLKGSPVACLLSH